MTEAHEQVKNGNVLKFLKDYWFIFLFILGGAFAWSEVRGTVIQNVDKIFKVEVKADTNTASINDIKLQRATDITQMKSDIGYIKDALGIKK